MIIVEGPDNSGKSEVVRSIAEEFRLVAIKNFRKPERPQDIDGFIARVIQSFAHSAVLDRCVLISEPVYGPLFREDSCISDRDAIIALLKINPAIVYCRPSIEKIRATIDARPQMRGVPKKLDELVAAYDSFMEKLDLVGLAVFPYNYEAPGARKLLTEFLLAKENL